MEYSSKVKDVKAELAGYSAHLQGAQGLQGDLDEAQSRFDKIEAKNVGYEDEKKEQVRGEESERASDRFRARLIQHAPFRRTGPAPLFAHVCGPLLTRTPLYQLEVAQKLAGKIADVEEMKDREKEQAENLRNHNGIVQSQKGMMEKVMKEDEKELQVSERRRATRAALANRAFWSNFSAFAQLLAPPLLTLCARPPDHAGGVRQRR